MTFSGIHMYIWILCVSYNNSMTIQNLTFSWSACLFIKSLCSAYPISTCASLLKKITWQSGGILNDPGAAKYHLQEINTILVQSVTSSMDKLYALTIVSDFFWPITNTNNTSSKEIRCNNLSLTILSKDSVQGEGAMRVTICWAPSHTRGVGNGTLTVGPVWDLKPESRTQLQQSGSLPTELTRRWTYLCYQDYELKLWHKVWMTLTDNFWEFLRIFQNANSLGLSGKMISTITCWSHWAMSPVCEAISASSIYFDPSWPILSNFGGNFKYMTLFEVE